MFVGSDFFFHPQTFTFSAGNVDDMRAPQLNSFLTYVITLGTYLGESE